MTVLMVITALSGPIAASAAQPEEEDVAAGFVTVTVRKEDIEKKGAAGEGGAIQAALDLAKDNATDAQPYKIVVEPGEYTVGEDSLLDNCIKFFDLCVDVAPDSLVILVNSKSFFTQEELEILFDHAVFCGVDLLLIESWPCDTVYELECKTVLDQHFLVM